MPRYKIVMDIDWDEEEINISDVENFLNQCGEDCYTYTRVRHIEEIADK